MQTPSSSAITKLKTILIICLILAVAIGGCYYYLTTLAHTPVLPSPVTEDISDRIDETGTTLENITITSSDKALTLIIPKGTKALDNDGKPLKSITIELIDIGKQVDTFYFALFPIGLAYNLKPEGATFNPPVKLAISYNETYVLQLGISEGELMGACYNPTTSEWELAYGEIDKETNVVIFSPSRTVYIFLCKAVEKIITM